MCLLTARTCHELLSALKVWKSLAVFGEDKSKVADGIVTGSKYVVSNIVDTRSSTVQQFDERVPAVACGSDTDVDVTLL